ncbi:MAG: M24 family metallopeptidase [Planctomycetes bacterium]|nr:M24 family metallopeptidase [Planctomycetota bacterium]
MSAFSRRDFLNITGAAGAVSLAGCASAKMQQNAPSHPALADLKPMTEGLPAFPENKYIERQQRLSEALELQKADGILLGPSLNLTYFTGVSWGASERLFACYYCLDASKLWIVPRFEQSRAQESIEAPLEEISPIVDWEHPGDRILTWKEHQDPHELVAAIIRFRRDFHVSLRVAIDSHLRSTHVLRIMELICGKNPSNAARIHGDETTFDGLSVIAHVRSVKSPAELARLRRANEITKKAIATVREHCIKPGVTENEASAWVNEAQRKLGLVNTWALVLFGPNAAFPHGTKDRRPLENGQFALFDCGGELEGYQSDITRTYYVGGKPTDRQRTIYRLVRNAQLAALAAAKPGAACESVDAAARKVIVDGGFGPGATYFTHRLGHGIGLEGHEDPYFCGNNKTKLEPGMTLSNEPGIYIPGEAGVRLEDIIVITETGAEVLGGELAPEL